MSVPSPLRKKKAHSNRLGPSVESSFDDLLGDYRAVTLNRGINLIAVLVHQKLPFPDVALLRPLALLYLPALGPHLLRIDPPLLIPGNRSIG